jgi:hypothetical protein
VTPASRDRLRALVRDIALAKRPMSERPDPALQTALENHLKQHAESLVANTPTLFAFRYIAARADLSASQKGALAVRLDELIDENTQIFPRDPGGCPLFLDNDANSLRPWLVYAIDTFGDEIVENEGAGSDRA